MNGGAVSQTFRLPTYRVRSEDFGITLGYNSGLAAGRALGVSVVTKMEGTTST
jgi:hypothetical protein